jgi:hypothetical protein
MDITTRQGHENLQGPIAELLSNLAEQGKPRPAVIVVDQRTEVTRDYPDLHDDVLGRSTFKAAVRCYATLDEFASACPRSEAVERVRRGLATHPEDVCICTINDAGVGISNCEVTVRGDSPLAKYEALSRQRRRRLDAQVEKACLAFACEFDAKVEGAKERFEAAIGRIDAEWGPETASAAFRAHMIEVKEWKERDRTP